MVESFAAQPSLPSSTKPKEPYKWGLWESLGLIESVAALSINPT